EHQSAELGAPSAWNAAGGGECELYLGAADRQSRGWGSRPQAGPPQNASEVSRWRRSSGARQNRTWTFRRLHRPNRVEPQRGRQRCSRTKEKLIDCRTVVTKLSQVHDVSARLQPCTKIASCTGGLAAVSACPSRI